MKTQLKKILNLTKSLKTKTSLSYITLTSCLTIALFSTLTSKAAATVLPTLFEVPMNNIKERASSKELAICIVLSFIIFALPGELKEQIRKHNERKLKKEETAQVSQSHEPEETTEEVNSNEIRETREAKETDKNENTEQ